MHIPLTLVLQGWPLIGTIMALLWWLQKIRCDASHVEVARSASLGLLATFYTIADDGYPPLRLLLAVLAVLVVLVGVWSFRLAPYLFLNRVWRKPEDVRYPTLRESWGDRAQLYSFIFFQAQAVLDMSFSPLLSVIITNLTAGVKG